MKVVDLVNNSSKSLILFFAGWGYDEASVAHLSSDTHDVKVVYDYRNISPLNLFTYQGYDSITVVAWSYGVWVANKVLQPISYIITKAFAINGTLKPVDDENGIPSALFEGTVATLSEKSYQKFQARVMGGTANLVSNNRYLPKRSFIEQKEELEALANHFKQSPSVNIQWNRAMCGTNDLIFPYKNLIHFWGDRTITKPYTHFVFDQYETWNELLNELSND